MAIADPLTVQFVMLETPERAITTWQQERTQWMAAGKFTPTGQTHDSLTYERRRIPTWAIVVGVLLFPLGLLAVFFAPRDTDVLSLRFAARSDGHTLVTMTGRAQAKSRASIIALSDEYNAAARRVLEAA